MKWISLFVYFYSICAHVNAQAGIGKVNVNETEGGVYSFNKNYNSGLEVPVYITVENAGDATPPVTQLDVTCELSPSGDGYTASTFSSSTIPYPEITETTVPFSNADSVPGRATTVQCWAEPASNPRANAPEFSKDVSIGKTQLFEIRPPGSVSFCDSTVTVPHEAVPATKHFYVELSETVEIGNASIGCSVGPGGGSMTINFQTPVLIPLGGRRTRIDYTVTSYGTPVTVSCTAETIPNSGEIQFDSATSAGQAEFVLETGTFTLEPDLTNLRNTEMTAHLVLADSGVAEQTTFFCEVTLADDLSEADDIINAPGCDAGAPPVGGTEAPEVTESFTGPTFPIEVTTGDGGGTPASNTSGWLLRNQLIEIPAGATFGLVQLYREANDVYAQDVRPQLIVIRCCAPDTVLDPKYSGAVTGLVAAAYLSPNVTTDWDAATAPGDEEKERKITEPHYDEISDCPCDLTLRGCDTDCCCDSDCSSADDDVFHCISGYQGGEDAKDPEYRCSAADYFGMKDWFPFMCVEIENSAFLGYFRQVEEATRSRSDYDDIADDSRPDYTFEEVIDDSQQERPPVEEGGTTDPYTDGISVKSALQDDNLLRRGANYRLTLPGRTGTGECVFSTPIRYLRDSDQSCVWRMKDSLCSNLSPLNALNYALPSQGALCSKGLLLLAQQAVGEVAFTNVNYLCAGDNTTLLAPYLRNTDTPRDRYPDDQPRLFDYDLPNDGEDCDFDPATGAYLCEELEVGVQLPTAPLPPRCSWDDGYTPAPTPSIDDSQGEPICENTVLDVYYNFTWSGAEIVMLNATIVLGDISFRDVAGLDAAERTDNDTTFLTQLLKVEFGHDMNYSRWDYIETEINSDPSQDNITAPWTREKYDRSGKEGYLDGLSVISGIALGSDISNDTGDGEFVYVDTNLTSQLTLWSPGMDGLCETAGRTRINFTQNAIGSCLLRLGFDELVNCSYTRKLVLNRQDNLMLANLIAMRGDPYPRDINHWVPVLRENISYILTELPTEGLNASDYVNDTDGICANVPATIHLDIMWAKAGEYDGVHINSIVGARVSYAMHTWSLSCSGATGPACYGDTRWREEVADGRKLVQSFTLQSSVQFIEVPPEKPKEKSRYVESREKDYNYCRYDACWEEAFYPWTEAYRGSDKESVLGTSLAFLIFAIALYAISRPWY